jgi:glycosyltransferase involved in cell wall biosynthesis
MNNRESFPPLRIACYGFADAQPGSVSTAGYLILRQLLALGHRVDFFNKTSFVRPRDLESFENYRYIDVSTPRFDRLVDRCPTWGGSILRHLVSYFAHGAFTRGILRAMREHHAREPYDVQLLLGDWAWGRIPCVPVVSWVQGPPETDARSVARHKRQIIDLCGWRSFIPLRLYAAYRGTLGLPPFRFTDQFIVGSAWSREFLSSYGISPLKIHSLAYPVDLKQFTPPAGDRSVNGPKTVLWLGRAVPRKRLDLFLDACMQLINRGVDLEILVVGDFRFTPGYSKLIERFLAPGRLRYIPRLSREEVVPLLRSASVVVQPSEDENFGTAIAEALACGTPVVVGPTNGTGDYIGDGGIRFSQYNASAVADAIAQALENTSDLRPRAREAAEQFFDPAKVTDGLISLLHRAISQTSRRSLDSNEREVPGSAIESASDAPTSVSA